jgi:hypothetical protein
MQWRLEGFQLLGLFGIRDGFVDSFFGFCLFVVGGGDWRMLCRSKF